MVRKKMSNCRDRLENEINKIGVTAVAVGLGVARNTVYNWLAKANIPLTSLKALEGLGADVAYILFGDVSAEFAQSLEARADKFNPQQGANAEEPMGRAADVASLPADEQLMLEAYRGMKAPDRKALLAEMLTGKKVKPSKEGLNVKGKHNRVAGGDYHEK